MYHRFAVAAAASAVLCVALGCADGVEAPAPRPLQLGPQFASGSGGGGGGGGGGGVAPGLVPGACLSATLQANSSVQLPPPGGSTTLTFNVQLTSCSTDVQTIPAIVIGPSGLLGCIAGGFDMAPGSGKGVSCNVGLAGQSQNRQAPTEFFVMTANVSDCIAGTCTTIQSNSIPVTIIRAPSPGGLRP